MGNSVDLRSVDPRSVLAGQNFMHSSFPYILCFRSSSGNLFTNYFYIIEHCIGPFLKYYFPPIVRSTERQGTRPRGRGEHHRRIAGHVRLRGRQRRVHQKLFCAQSAEQGSGHQSNAFLQMIYRVPHPIMQRGFAMFCFGSSPALLGQ